MGDLAAPIPAEVSLSVVVARPELLLTARHQHMSLAGGLAAERIVRGVFLQRRKTLSNALAPVAASLGRTTGERIERSGGDGRRRPAALTVGDYARLSRAVR